MPSDFSPSEPAEKWALPLDLSPEAERILQALEQGERAQIATRMPGGDSWDDRSSRELAQDEE